MSIEKDRQAAVDYAVRLQASINMAGVQSARQDNIAAGFLSKSLEAAGVSNDEELLASYEALHRKRFESGDLTVIFNGVRLQAGAERA